MAHTPDIAPLEWSTGNTGPPRNTWVGKGPGNTMEQPGWGQTLGLTGYQNQGRQAWWGGCESWGGIMDVSICSMAFSSIVRFLRFFIGSSRGSHEMPDYSFNRATRNGLLLNLISVFWPARRRISQAVIFSWNPYSSGQGSKVFDLHCPS